MPTTQPIHRRGGISVYDYMDYRKFLVEWFLHRKAVNRHFSHRLFASRAGITSSGYLSEVMTGVRNLSRKKVVHFAKGLELGEREAVYFDRLVAFNHAKTHSARQTLYEALVQSLPPKLQTLKRGQMEYFSKWFYVAVREALAIVKVAEDYGMLAARLRPPITAAQAKAAVRLLDDLGLVERGEDGAWRVRHVSLLSKRDESAPLLVRAFQGEMIAKAREALETVPWDQRDISTVTMSISAQGMQRLQAAAKEFRARAREIAQADRGEDRVVQLNIQIFPLTRSEEPGQVCNEDAHAQN